MTRLFAITCNDPARLVEVVSPLAQALTAEEAAHGFGVASYQDGEVLLQRQPKPAAPVDFTTVLRPLTADIVVGNLVAPGSPAATENTPPFRYRSWVFGVSGRTSDIAEQALAMAQAAPAFLGRQQRGVATGERLFTAVLGGLYQRGSLDDAEPTQDDAVGALRDVVKDLDARVAAAGGQPFGGAMVLTNGRFLVCARLGAPVHWRRTGTDRPPPRPHTGAASELRHVVVIAEPRNGLPEGFEAVAPRSVITVSRDFVTAVHQLDTET
jgi:predicted glutamine amidotransferase